MARISTVLFLLACVIALAAISKRSRIPYPTMLVLAGLAIALIPGLPTVRIDPQIVFLVFLPPILYSAAWNTWWHDFRRNIRSISLLAMGLTLVTAAGVAVVAHAVIPGMSWATAFVLGAIVSPPDASAATAICRTLGVSRRIVTLIEGESLVNDSVGLIAYRFAVAAVVTGQFSFGQAAGQLLLGIVGGIAVGIGAGFLISLLHKRIKDPTITTTLSLLAPYIAYLPAESIQVSGVLATVAAGLFVSRESPRLFTPQSRLEIIHVWDVLVMTLNGLAFVIIGLQLVDATRAMASYRETTLLWFGLAIVGTTILIRVIWVFPMSSLANRMLAKGSGTLPWQARSIVAWTGMRGIVSLSAAMAIPMTVAPLDPGSPAGAFPHRDLIVLLTFAVIFATLVLQSLTLPAMIRSFGPVVADDNQHEELVARLLAASAALKKLEETAAHHQHGDPALERVCAEYTQRVESAAKEVSGAADHTKGRASPEDSFRRLAISEQRKAIVELRNRGELTEEVFRSIERDLDLDESRFT